MATYKDIEEIIKAIEDSTLATWGKGLGSGRWSHSVQLKDNIVRLMKVAPAPDVVKVVRCKDCRYWEEIGFDPITEYTFGYCRHYHWQDEENSRETNGQDYCSYGRREE